MGWVEASLETRQCAQLLAMGLENSEGWWWLPGERGSAQVGRLSAGGSGSWSLDLLGGLAPNQAMPIEVGAELARVPVIHGHLVAGGPGPRFITLLDCSQTGANATFVGLASGERTERWSFSAFAQGHDVLEVDDKFEECRIRLTNLLDWSGRSRPSVDRSDSGASASVESVTVGDASLPGATIEFVLDHLVVERQHESVLRHGARFDVRPGRAIDLDRALTEYALPLRSLLAFLTLGHVDLDTLAVRVASPSGDPRGRLWFDYHARLQRPLDNPPAPRTHEMLATWPELEIPVDRLITSWFEITRQMDKVIALLLVPLHARHLFADDHLMTAFVAMEAYHDAQIGGTSIDPSEHAKRVEDVVAAAPTAHQAWAREMLGGRNNKGQRRKLREVIERADDTGRRVLETVPDFERQAVKSRQMVAHPHSTGGEAGAMYIGISYGLRWILRHCLLVDLGLPTESASDLISRNRRFTGELDLLRSWTA